MMMGDSPPPFRLPRLAELSDCELLAPSPSEPDFTRFSFSAHGRHTSRGGQRGKGREKKRVSGDKLLPWGECTHSAPIKELFTFLAAVKSDYDVFR